MSLFWEHAAQIMEAAIAAAGVGFVTSQSMTVLIGSQGGIHVIPNNDWPLDRLAEERGADMAYRVTQESDRVTLNGLDHGLKCHLETERKPRPATRLLKDQPRYFLDPPPHTAPPRS